MLYWFCRICSHITFSFQISNPCSCAGSEEVDFPRFWGFVDAERLVQMSLHCVTTPSTWFQPATITFRHQLQAKKGRGSLPKSHGHCHPSLISATIVRSRFTLQFSPFNFLLKYNIPTPKCTYHATQGILRNPCV